MRRFIALTGLALACLGAGLWASGTSTLVLNRSALYAEHPMFGGLSAIEITDGGSGFWALSDRGALLRGQMQREATGEITGITLGGVSILTARDGSPGSRRERDSEGLAVAEGGRIFISFEGDHRVLSFNDSQLLPIPPWFRALPNNGSLEALAISPDGSLFTLPEESDAAQPEIPVFRFQNEQWDRDLSLPRRGSFLPVGADFDDEGRFYLLERHFSALTGFSNRIRRFTYGPEGLTDEELLWQSRAGAFANLEGISLWRDGQGRLIATMIADDNFSPILPNQIVEILLTP